MTGATFPLTRRQALAGLGGLILAPADPAAATVPRQVLALQASPGSASLRAGLPDVPVWALGVTPGNVLRFKRGDEVEVTLENQLPAPVVLNWHGIDGAAASEPLIGRPALATGGKDSFVVQMRHSGSFLCDLRLLGDGGKRPLPALSFIVAESEQVPADRDETLLIEDWRLGSDGPLAPGGKTSDAATLYTVNGRPAADITLRANERLRLRLINGCHRTPIALKLHNHQATVMAIDGQPAEPFLARDGALVLAPGTRVDAFVDAAGPPGSTSPIVLHDGREPRPIGRLLTANDTPARPAPLAAPISLPSNGLPPQLELKNAHRFELALGGPRSDWIAPGSLTTATTPAFRTKAGRIVVLTLTNREALPTVFHLHGHHFRLLDRLDDGWKPFWLDTLLIDAGQTQRIAFAATSPGRWLVEAMAADWAAPRLVRWFAVE